mgnify:FL=1
MEKLLMEKMAVKTGIVPVDLNTGANTGIRFDMKNMKRATFICLLGAGTSTTTHSFALKQHDAASSGNTKALSVGNPYYHKVNTATYFTKVAPTVDADTYDLHSVVADYVAVVVFEVLAEQLDRDNGYEWVSLNIADTGGAQLGSQVILADAEFLPSYGQVV